jgi:hypothetical protein
MQRRDGIGSLGESLNGFEGARLGIPQVDGRVGATCGSGFSSSATPSGEITGPQGQLTGNNDRITLPSKLHSFYPTRMPTPSLHGRSLLHIPEEHLSISSDTRKARIVSVDRNVQDRVAMRLIFLDGRGRFDGGVRP